MSLLIKDTTEEERRKIVEDSLSGMYGNCDGCMPGLADMYDDYIEGRKELAQINAEYRARYVSDAGPERIPDRSCPEGY